MSITINSNLAATRSSLNLKRASDRLSQSLQRLSSGNRIVNPSDDAGGLAVAMKLQSSLRRATVSMQNTQNGKSFLQMQDSVLKVAGEIVDRMSELKSFYNDISKNELDRETYNHEFKELQKELLALKSQKFNGVSLFATSSPDRNNLKIITSDDGLGEHIQIGRIGLFENLKSKFGADGELNSGSQGSYRQLIGDFVNDAGILDANPGYASRDYKSGDVVFRRGATPAEQGYFMAVKDVVSGAKIEDTEDVSSNWIRIADVNGKGFSEAYPKATSYDHNNLKFDSKGNARSYLKGDIVKVQAHWNDPNSYVFMRALTDIPRNITLNKILLEGVGEGKYFEFVGSDKNDNKPTTSYVHPNKDHETPNSMVSGDVNLLKTVVSLNKGNEFTPTFAQVGSGTSASIYTPTTNWGIQEWNNGSFEYGDVVYDSSSATSFFKSLSDKVKGQYLGAEYSSGEFVQSEGTWFKAMKDVAAEDKPVVSTADAHVSISNYEEGNVVLFNGAEYTAKDSLQGIEIEGTESLPDGELIPGTIIKVSIGNSSKWLKVIGDPSTTIPRLDGNYLSSPDATQAIAPNTIFYNTDEGKYQYFSGYDAATDVPLAPSTVAVTFNADPSLPAGALSLVNEHAALFQDVTAEVKDPSVGTDYWEVSSWQEVADPLADTTFANDVTANYADLSDDNYWTKTHFGALVDKTIGTDYERGDNIYYQGKHYVYVSHLSSSDPVFTAGSGQDGITGFEQLLMQGAVVELSMHVDTIGGGGAADLANGVYYRPNQSLEYIDRLPDSGIVRTNSIERRTDPTINADGIYNTNDDIFYGGLNPGNDGIYGSMDDFYTTTAFSQVAKQGGHVDADADNNKDLLNTSNTLANFSVADFVDYIQTIANFRAVNGGTMTRLDYASRMLEENKINLESAHGRIMDTDIAIEAARMAQQNVLMQAGAAMVSQANQMNSVVLQLLQ